MCHSEVMNFRSVIDGVFDLCGYTSIAELTHSARWLREEYARRGLDPRHIRRDVLEHARRQGRLHSFSFGDLLRLHVYRTVAFARDEAIGAANDNDADEVPYERFQNSKVTREIDRACRDRAPFTAAHLPRVKWSPFKPIAQVKFWSRDQLITLRRDFCRH